MKRLKVILTLLLVLCCSMCLFACGEEPEKPGPEPENPGGTTTEAKYIAEVQLTGQKLSFNEGEEFSAGELKVSVYYQGEDDETVLSSDGYEIDSTAYDKSHAGQYIIYVIPKNQPADLWDGKPESKDNRVKKSYYVSVDHSWIDDGEGKAHCNCGAKRELYENMEDKVVTVAWGKQAQLTQGAKTYPHAQQPIAGENHISYGSLVKGQSLKLSLQITGLTRSADGPGAASAWDSPLMGIRNAGVGMIPREDGWIIATAAGFALPATSNIPSAGGTPATGTATEADDEWIVYANGTSWPAGSSFPDNGKTPTKWSSVDVEYNYQADGVFMIRHTLHKFDNTTSEYIITTKVPDAAYDVVVYGEYCDFTITRAEFVASRAIESYEITSEPAELVQPAGKMFNTAGLNTKATFSDQGTLEGNYNAYAFHDVTPEDGGEPVKTRVNLATEPLQADFYDFMVEFNGMQAWFTKDGKASTAENKDENQKITVIATPIVGAVGTAIKADGVSFESPDVAYDYAVTADKQYIRLVATGSAVKALSAQAEKLGGSTHFIAFKLLTNLAEADLGEISASTAANVSVKATKVGATVDVIVGLKAGFAKTFDLNLKEDVKVQIDLSAVTADTTATAELVENNTTLDAGGTYVVKFSGLTGDVSALTLVSGSGVSTVADIDKAVKGTYTEGTVPTRNDFFRISNSLYIVKIDDETSGELTVTYWVAAPDLGNLTYQNATTNVVLRSGDTVLARTSLVLDLKVSSGAIDIGDGVYVKANNNKLLVFAFQKTDNVKDGFQFNATLNIEHAYVESEPYDMLYNVGLAIRNGAAAWLDENVLTTHTSAAARLVAFGTVNNTNDYDIGAILVASIHLPAIGVRETDSEAVYRFTANENVEAGQNEYTIYTVGDEDKTAPNANAIDPAKKTPEGERKTLQKGSCVSDGVEAYQDGTFFYGALIEYATGAHTFNGYADGSNTDTCTVCGAVKTKVVQGDSTYEYTLLSEENMSSVTNPATESAWWNVDFKIGTQQIGAGNFAVRFVWEQVADPNYVSNGAIVLAGVAEGQGDIRKRFLEPATDQDWAQTLAGSGLLTLGSENPEDDSVITYKITTADGSEITYDQDGYKAFNDQDAPWGGKYEVTAVRLGTTLYVYEKVVTVGGVTLTSELVITNFTTEALTVYLWGNSVFVENPKVNVGVVAATVSDEKTIKYEVGLGQDQQPEEGKHYPWIAEDFYDLPNLQEGKMLTVFGTEQGNCTSNWLTLLWELKDGYTGRLDNYGWRFGEPSLFSETVEKSNSIEPQVEQPDPNAENFWAKFREIASDCEWEISFLWTGRVVNVTIVLEGAGSVYTQNYKLNITGTIPEAGLGVHLTGESTTITYKGYTM